MPGTSSCGYTVDLQHLREPAQRTIGAVLQDQEHHRDLVAGRSPERGDAVIGRPIAEPESRQRARKRGLLLTQLRSILLGILNGARTFLRKVLIARRLLPREYQRCLRLIDLRLVG